MVLSLQIGGDFVRAIVACANHERISGLELLSETTVPRRLNRVTVPSFYSFILISLRMSLALIDISLVFSALFHILKLVQVLSRLQLGFLVSVLPQLQHLCHRKTADL